MASVFFVYSVANKLRDKHSKDTWQVIRMSAIAYIIGSVAVYFLANNLIVLLPKNIQKVAEINDTMGLLINSAIILAVVFGPMAYVKTFFGMENKIAKPVSYGFATMLSFGLIATLLVKNISDDELLFLGSIILITYSVISCRYYWYKGLQDKMAVVVAITANVLLTYGLLWQLGYASATMTFKGSWQAMLAPAMLVGCLYVIDIVFGESGSVVNSSPFIWNRRYSKLLALCISLVVLAQLTGFYDQFEAKTLQVVNKGETSLVRVKKVNALNRKIDGYTYNEVKEGLDKAIDNYDEKEITRLTKIAKAHLKAQRDIENADFDDPEMLKNAKNISKTAWDYTKNVGYTIKKAFIEYDYKTSINSTGWKSILLSKTPQVIGHMYDGDRIEYRRTSEGYTFFVLGDEGPQKIKTASTRVPTPGSRFFVDCNFMGVKGTTVKFYSNQEFTLYYRLLRK